MKARKKSFREVQAAFESAGFVHFRNYVVKCEETGKPLFDSYVGDGITSDQCEQIRKAIPGAEFSHFGRVKGITRTTISVPKSEQIRRLNSH